MNLQGFLAKLLAALPDAATACAFAAAWIAPRHIPTAHIDKLFLVMMLEFFVVHSSIFYAAILAMPDNWRLKRSQAYLGLAMLYLLLVAVFSLSNGSTWPIGAFFWLSISRLVSVWAAPAERTGTIRLAVSLWAISVGTFVLGAMAVLLLPVPSLGITPELASSLPVHGSFHPHQILAWGSTYFFLQAWARFSLTRNAEP